MSTVKLAHLSDLHCNSTQEWDRRFERVKACLLHEAPNILVITGDCVHHPLDEHFTHLSGALQQLCQGIITNHPYHKLFMIAIPGNHDLSFWGNKFPSIGPRSAFDKHKGTLLYVYNHTGDLDWDILTRAVFTELGIALFPLDSNPKGLFELAFARGKVENPYDCLRTYAEAFCHIAATTGIAYSSCPKLALLHHHPFPLPADQNDDRLEPYNILLNAHHFLSAASSFDIDIVLHGHRHVSGLIEVTLPTIGNSSMHVCACASTCSTREHRHELHIIESKNNGTCVLRTYESDDKNPIFRAKPEKTLIPYGRKRKKRYKGRDIPLAEGDPPIAEVKSKTKVVNILPDGKAAVRISLDNIQWMPDTRHEQMHVKFNLQADIGRIVECWSYLGEERSSDDLLHGWRPRAQNSDNDAQRALLSEDYVFNVTPFQNIPRADKEAFCTLRYPILNAFVIDKTQHEEAYAEWPDDRINREEACSIRADYPTSLLRLIIRFPFKEAFPNPASIYVDTHKTAAVPGDGTSLYEPDVLRREYLTMPDPAFLDEREKTYLTEIDALSVCPEINLIALLVRYPQPDVMYTVRWTVPDDPSATRFTSIEREKLTALRDAFIDPKHARVKGFYDRVCLLLKKAPGWERLSFYLLGYDRNKKYLQVVHGPNTMPGWPLRVGRGASGKAFKMLLPEYFEKRQIALWPTYDREEGTYFVEPLHADFDPEAVLALPIMYPYLLKDTDSTKRYGRSFAVLAIAANHRDSPVGAFSPWRRVAKGGVGADDREDNIGHVYSVIHGALTEYMSESYSS